MTNEEERAAFLINYLNSRTVLNHAIRSAISMTICVIVLSFFMKVTPREIVNILYFVIGWNALLSFVPYIGLHYIKAALANVILAGIVIAASFYM